MNKKALIVGVNHYTHIGSLNGCVNDATNINTVLSRNGDEHKTINFETQLRLASDDSSQILRKELKTSVESLFKSDVDMALFYFAGHGYIEKTGGYLLTSECKDGDDGLSTSDILLFVNSSPAKNKIVILDCCHAGIMGNIQRDDKTVIGDGVTILTASSPEQYAQESNGSGVFTTLLVDALNGSAADLVGNITPGGVYAHIDNSLGLWQQRPIFKTNVSSFITLRTVSPTLSISDLKQIVELFVEKENPFDLDPSYEPKSDSPNPENVLKFRILQKFNRVNLVVPVGAEHMYYAAMKSKSCRLTKLGEYYWNLVDNGRI